MIAPSPLLIGLDYAGVAVFAATGALAAARRKHDLVTFAFFAAITGIGGGTLRDLLIGAPVFWVQDAGYVAVCIVGACAVWVLGYRPWRFNLMLWLDAVGLAAYGVIGAAKAAAWGVPPLVCVVMGALTACFGGVVRDVLAGEPSILLRREITVSAALLASAVFVLARWVGLEPLPSAILGFTAGFTLRAGALLKGWSLPPFPGTVSDGKD
ncbi:MAG TPA: trimeric intracellular cation channel family protein [Caulobacteraceae bacterium]|nr:trimeric intracellular cation channel family protein [Caulobacteraceae bacterium]